MVSTQLKYFRVTNLSGSNTVRLAFYKVYTDGNDEAFIVKLEAGHSFVASTDDFSADDNFNSGSALISAATDVQWTTVRGYSKCRYNTYRSFRSIIIINNKIWQH